MANAQPIKFNKDEIIQIQEAIALSIASCKRAQKSVKTPGVRECYERQEILLNQIDLKLKGQTEFTI